MKNLVVIENNQALTTSLKVAEVFGKQHKNVIRDIHKLISELENQLKKEPIFAKSEYRDKRGRVQPMYYLNRNGFTLLAMEYTGKKALKFKLKYIEAFDKMEAKLKSLAADKRKSLDWQQHRQAAIDSTKAVNSVGAQLQVYLTDRGNIWAELNPTYVYAFIGSRVNRVARIKKGTRPLAPVEQQQVVNFSNNFIIGTILDYMKEEVAAEEFFAKVDAAIENFKQVARIDTFLDNAIIAQGQLALVAGN